MILSARGLRKDYRQGTEVIRVLDGVDLDLEAGQTVAILGQSGSGKSTLLGLLAGLDRPDGGTIHLRGQDLGTLSEEALTAYRAKEIGIVFQQFHLMSTLTARENVMLPLEILGDAAAPEKADRALDSVGLSHRARHFPRQLSGGEQQRVAIARALVTEPALLLGDEPSGNLDDRTGSQVMDLLFDLVEKNRMTLVLVTHNEKLAAACGRRLTLGGGRLQG